MNAKEAVFPFLKLMFKDRRNLLKSLLSYTKEADKKLYFQKEYGMKRLPSVNIDDVGKIDVELTNYTYLDGTSRPIDIALLMAVCNNYEDCNYLEIGSWRGESLFNVSKIAKKCTSVSLSKEEMIKVGLSEKSTDLRCLFSKNVPNIKHIEANSQTFDFNKLNEKFDVIFIDGDHTYAGVKSDTMKAFPLLRDENSVIIWHDCGGGYEGNRYEVVSAIMDGAPEDKRKNIYRVTNTICGIYTSKKIDANLLESPQVPKRTFTMGIKSVPYTAEI